MRMCSVDGCSEKHYGKGYCKKHYLQNYRHGKILDRTKYDRNEIIEYEDYIEIILYDSECEEIARTSIDKQDYEIVKQYKWSLTNTGYAIHKNSGTLLHRLIMNDYESDVIDHIDGNPLNNRRNNLRKATYRQNQYNVTNNGRGRSNEDRKGVVYRKENNKWRAYITVDGKRIYLGHFETKDDAIKAREEAEIKYFGEYRRK